jgi:hypothetical protein
LSERKGLARPLQREGSRETDPHWGQPMFAHKLSFLPFFLLAGCGGSGLATSPFASEASSQSVVWVGIDQRPIAVGAQITLTFQLPLERTSASEALTVVSSDPNIVAVTSVDLAHNRVLVRAMSTGQAVIELQGRHVSSNLPVVAAEATNIDFFDQNYLAAGMQTDLPRFPLSFDLLTSGQQTIGAILTDHDGNVLNSRGLTNGNSVGAVSYTKEEPEMFILSPSPALGSQGQFSGFLAKTGNGPFYLVTLVDTVAQVVVVTKLASDQVSVIAVAQAQDASGHPIFGVNDWTFQLNTSAASFVRLSPAAVKVLPPMSASGPVILTATAQNEGVSGSIPLFQ